MTYNRRAFIKSIGFLYGSLLLMPSCTKNISDSSFDEQYNACLEALCNQIIPDDEYPGAVKTGTPGFIKKQLSLHLDYCKENYRNGLQALQTYCQNKFNRNFENLSSSQQINLMKQMEQNLLTGEEWNKLSSGSFFAMILKHTMMGFYGAPRHGGNKGYASYKMLRLDVPLVVGQNRY
ncbi:MAG: gluconate 2-dehydrogenase subunit 3 family protein [Bacteroidales bacterium]|nr:gluconate 2-dehydrogenase subunit 3 family protein [Bacteroidales bacterium]